MKKNSNLINFFKFKAKQILGIYFKIYSSESNANEFRELLSDTLGVYDSNYKRNYEISNVNFRFIDSKSQFVNAEITLKIKRKFSKKTFEKTVVLLAYHY